MNLHKILEYIVGREIIWQIEADIYPDNGNLIIGYWDVTALGAQPTEQEIIDTGNSPEFAVWYAEHGGDPLLTLRRQAKEYLDAQDKAEANIFRAFILLTLGEINSLRSHVTQILDAIDSASNLTQLKTNIGAIPDLPQRTAVQIRNAIKAKTTAGEADS